MDFKERLREIPDWPKEGINFIDITTLVKDGQVFKKAIADMAAPFRGQGIDLVVGPEARGFLIGAPLAYELGAGFVPLRKPGKLPAETAQVQYQLEYGSDSLEIHQDAIKPGQKVIIADDLLATGGTIAGTVKLVEELGGKILGISFLVELTFLNGKGKLGGHPVYSLVQY
ncbi:MAG: adenine phosphoribosyltransferase [Clostridia bacterium]|nr:adenine phosphoribosyltransferase [Clostridia bacterium]